ncbi:arginyltransferase [Thalassomonas haliotis]|uniref:Aspartate/glutamate leucyltransferase n=1 Tax=Thalassomonas haliotis TaxID=485448 RepID=A0ABY7V9A2_9GAMM|nr:arginyltransferase [Thalassomonas haliotis]WDE09473.1 arginyltransferase [Thalassomonas haliotis]
MSSSDFKLGITKTFPCNYLPEEQERLLIAVDDRFQNNDSYTWLMTQGFRRSGNQIYRPHCPSCNACQSIRVLVDSFSPSRSQKRLLKRSSHFVLKKSTELKDDYYPLYEKYINTVHADGAMYPASYQQFKNFLACKISEQLFIETWDKEKLISVAVTDKLENALSAVYTFYHPDYRKSALGILSILNQIRICAEIKLPYLYLGYQIDNCQKMNYKDRYFPYEKLTENNWLIVNK